MTGVQRKIGKAFAKQLVGSNPIAQQIIYFNLMRKIFQKIFCRYNSVDTVYIEDKIYDRMTDNDDLEDPSTFIKIDYCINCGKVLSMVHTFKTNNYTRCYGFGSWIKVPIESCRSDIEKFEKITGIDTNRLTLYKRK